MTVDRGAHEIARIKILQLLSFESAAQTLIQGGEQSFNGGGDGNVMRYFEIDKSIRKDLEEFTNRQIEESFKAALRQKPEIKSATVTVEARPSRFFNGRARIHVALRT